jgi:hypothetical protein
MLFGEMIAFYHRNLLKPRGSCCGKNAELYNITEDVICKLFWWFNEIRDFYYSVSLLS